VPLRRCEGLFESQGDLSFPGYYTKEFFMKMKKLFIVTAFLLATAGMYADDANWLDAGVRAGGGFWPAGNMYVERSESLSSTGNFSLA